MAGTRVLLLVTGGIAAYKSCLLTRLLVQAGFSVKVAMTAAAQRFVAPLTFQVLSEHPVATDLWGEGQTDALDHVNYARWAELALIAPATADVLAKAAAGIGDDIVTTLLLAFPGPLIAAPAMNDNMWRHPATRANVATLRERGVEIVAPGDGHLACGVQSAGRMSEPEALLAVVRRHAAALPARRDDADPAAAAATEPAAANAWLGRKVVVTAGPTREPIDPVRYLANRSSGVFGYAIAADAVRRGAEVTLISGPTRLEPPRGLAALVPVGSAAEMAGAVGDAIAAGADWLIMAAAVADYAPAAEDQKIKKEQIGPVWHLEMSRTVDILGQVVPARRQPGLKVVGFALETADRLAGAQAKLTTKGLDFVVANDPTETGSGFGPGEHRVQLIGPSGMLWDSDSRPKPVLARELLDRLGRAAVAEAGS